MTTYYLDTSALVKCYVRESGTTWIRDLVLAPQLHVFYTVRLAGPELVAALFRKARTNEISHAGAGRLAQGFKVDWRRRYRILEVNAEISDSAMELVEIHGLRGYDAVHLATTLLLHRTYRAHQLPDIVFLAADDTLLQAAALEGLCADNPNCHS